MIVADTGNNRLQVFHVEALDTPPEDPSIQASAAATTSTDENEGFYSSSPVGGASLDGTTGTWKTDSSGSGSFAAWARFQAPRKTKTSSSIGDGNNTAAAAAGGRPGEGEPQQESPAAKAGGGDEDESSRACLLVFTGDEDAGRLRKRRTAGESEAAEGPLCQPCDVAYWRARRRSGRESDGETSSTVWAWTPGLPEWFSSQGVGGGRRPASSAAHGMDDEEEARRRLMSPVFPSQNKKSARGDKKRTDGPASRKNNGGPGDADGYGEGSDGGEGEPVVGAFVVRDTGIPDELQLLFVAKTKVTGAV